MYIEIHITTRQHQQQHALTRTDGCNGNGRARSACRKNMDHTYKYAIYKYGPAIDRREEHVRGGVLWIDVGAELHTHTHACIDSHIKIDMFRWIHQLRRIEEEMDR